MTDTNDRNPQPHGGGRDRKRSQGPWINLDLGEPEKKSGYWSIPAFVRAGEGNKPLKGWRLVFYVDGVELEYESAKPFKTDEHGRATTHIPVDAPGSHRVTVQFFGLVKYDEKTITIPKPLPPKLAKLVVRKTRVTSVRQRIDVQALTDGDHPAPGIVVHLICVVFTDGQKICCTAADGTISEELEVVKETHCDIIAVGTGQAKRLVLYP